MSAKGLRCVVEIDVHAVNSPGTCLQCQNDVYLSICLFGKILKTTKTSSIFPLIFYEKLRFEKVFYASYDPSHISAALEDMMVHVDLMQIKFNGSDDRLLAWYNSSALQFLYPIPQYFPRFGIHDREVLMERSVLFPGISPKLEFSTRTVIEEVSNFAYNTPQKLSDFTGDHRYCKVPPAMRCSDCRCQGLCSVGHRQRFASPKSANNPLEKDFNDKMVICTLRKPPFVVRKVDDRLIGRQPSGDHLVMTKYNHVSRKSDSTDVYDCCNHGDDCVICEAFHRYLGRPYHHDIYACPLSHLACISHSRKCCHPQTRDKNENTSNFRTKVATKEKGSGFFQSSATKHVCKVHEECQCIDCQRRKPNLRSKSSSSFDPRIYQR